MRGLTLFGLAVLTVPLFSAPQFQDDLMAMESEVAEARKHNTKSKFCLTPGCVKAAAEIIENMNMDADPCEDFYEFACGKFVADSVIPDHKTSVGAFSTVRDKLNERLKRLFEANTNKLEPPVFQSVRNLYNSCMNLENIEESSRDEVLEIVKEFGGWPVLGNDFDEANFAWHKLMDTANRKGYSTGKIISVSISTDSDDSTKRIVEIDQPSLGLEREYLVKGIDDKDVKAYYKYMVDTAVYLGADEAEASQQLKESLQFEIDLAEITMKREDRRNKTALNNKMKLGEMKTLYDLDWVKIANDMLENPTEYKLDENEIINVATPKVIQNIKTLLDKTPAKVIANYMMWRYVKGSVGFMGKEARNIKQEYSKVLTGTETEAPRWETCVKNTAGLGGSYLYWYEGSLTNAIGSMYARKHFPLDNKKVADEMVSYIRKEFKIMLDELEWMDEVTRQKAHAKAESMTPFIAYAEEILNDELLNQFYKGLNINGKSYINNYLTLKRFINKYYTKTFRQPINKKDWRTHGGAAIVNAFYSPQENSIQFPAGILDGVFFQADRPSYLNYGAIGMVVGHEITHGFDDQGSQRDGEGNLVDWWEKFAKDNYLQKTQCIIDQYGNYSVDINGEPLNLNGINTQGENIADNGGFKEAIRAYERLIKEYGTEPRLPGLTQYTPNQMFWLSGASVWCTAMRPATLKNRVLTDPHSPSEFRVNGPYRNLKEFSRDWNCPVGSPMNPVKKCSVW